MTDRYREFRDLAGALGVDAVALVPGPNFERLYHAHFSTSERPTLVVIPAKGPPAAIVPNLELSSWGALGFEGEVFDWRDQDGYAAAFDALAKHLPIRSLAVEGQVMRVFVHHALAGAYGPLDIRDAEGAISGLRLTKSADEVAALEEAIRISETALAEVIETVRIGTTEKEVERRLTAALFAHGAEGNAFGPLIGSGAHSANAHADARDVAIGDGDALLIDFGARWGGFAADITRTFFVGSASDEAHEVYETVKAANARGHEIARAGITAHEIDDAVIGVLEASPFADRIRTKTGHGLGREVHEAPYIMRGNHEAVPAGAVFTNEPGLYAVGRFGVRIEDDILVTDDGNRSLTTFPRELRILG
ncbi:M24 family metallopeptidase [Roseivivax sediminis]|uniref:Creatinase/Prolidase N-terminal domain-containing protein n=1 Tax=Roseivivax sediminis TaxID=936889 RepID=A0A1I1ZAS9_9RHOB|nr:Xaa-Pro peptidase family protein [Roseivivax sediminis]SFE28866.1 Creatinase/Prolidase N-terminal domain-containing protein [Roseivivax sediminis]